MNYRIILALWMPAGPMIKTVNVENYALETLSYFVDHAPENLFPRAVEKASSYRDKKLLYKVTVGVADENAVICQQAWFVVTDRDIISLFDLDPKELLKHCIQHTTSATITVADIATLI